MKVFASIYIGSYEISMKVFEVYKEKGLREIDCLKMQTDFPKTRMNSEKIQTMKKILYYLLLPYYTTIAQSTPMSKKAIIYSALVYFFLPIDLIPDALPIVGFTDDLGAVVASVIAIAESLTPEIKQKAKEKAEKIVK